MSRKKLMEEMDAKEIKKWMAYEMSIAPKVSERLRAEISKEATALLSDEERADLIKKALNLAGTK